MATIQEDIIVIKVSKLVRTNEPRQSLIDEQTITALEQVVQELLQDNVIVEIETAQ